MAFKAAVPAVVAGDFVGAAAGTAPCDLGCCLPPLPVTGLAALAPPAAGAAGAGAAGLGARFSSSTASATSAFLAFWPAAGTAAGGKPWSLAPTNALEGKVRYLVPPVFGFGLPFLSSHATVKPGVPSAHISFFITCAEAHMHAHAQGMRCEIEQ